MNHWKTTIPNFIHDVHYENLIKNPNNEIKRIIKICGLKWDQSCLKYYRNKRLIKTSSDTQVRQKMYKTSINSWRNYELFLNSYYKNIYS